MSMTSCKPPAAPLSIEYNFCKSPSGRPRHQKVLKSLRFLPSTRPILQATPPNGAAGCEIPGARCHVNEPAGCARPGATLTATRAPHQAAITAFADTGAPRLSWALSGLCPSIFSLVLPPSEANGLGVMVLNWNTETHFSFTNALGLMCCEQAQAVMAAAAQYPRAGWIIALHHHVVEYPRPVKALSKRIGTSLINGSWFLRRLRPLAGRAVLMHGHRHVDWIDTCGRLLIVSAPSPVMVPPESTGAYFLVHTLSIGADGKLALLAPRRVTVPFDPAGAAPSGTSAVVDDAPCR